MKIFIGSSSNYVTWNIDGSVNLVETRKGKLGKLVSSLRRAGFIVEPWWEDTVLTKGENLLENLIIKARTCDGGVFVFGKDDFLVRSKSKFIAAPRGNVLLECGMFYGVKGRNRTLPIKDGDFSQIKIPSDIFGTILPDLNDRDLHTTTTRFFKKAFEDNQYQKFTFYFNSSSIKEIIEKNYLKWSTKSLYVGTESARRWKAIEEDPQYLIQRNIVPQIIKEIHKRNIVDFKKVDNVISFGPGCGIFDNAVVTEIYKVNNNIAYIPIDINPHLAFEASNLVNDSNPRLRVPFAIIDDFEQGHQYVSEIIKKKFNDYKQVNFFLMLGGTFSNLEGIESDISKKLDSWMDNDDYLFIDAFIKSDTYLFQKDTIRHVTGLPQTYKDLMTNACIKKYFSISQEKDTKADLKFIEDIMDNLASFLKEKEEDASSRLKYSEIEDTNVATYNFQINSHKNEILIAKRYNFINIKEFLEENFNLIYSYDGLLGNTEETGRGLFLLKKK